MSSRIRGMLPVEIEIDRNTNLSMSAILNEVSIIDAALLA